MTLSDRIAARSCAVVECELPRVEGSLFCKDGGHLGDYWHNRLDKTPEGYVPRRRFRARDETGRVRLA